MSKHPKAETTCESCGATFIGGVSPRARRCPVCRYSGRAKAHPKYAWTPERDALLRAQYDSTVRGRAQAIADQFGWPGWVVKKRAQQMGLSRPWPADRREWTDQEVAFLSQWTGRRDSHWIARRLKRSLTSTVLKQKRLHLARRVRDGYTLGDLCACFGVDHHTIRPWVDRGWLPVQRRATARTDAQGDPWSVQEADIVAFIKTHPEAVDLRKVDQAWFFDVVVQASPLRAVTAEAATVGRSWIADVRRVVARLDAYESFSMGDVHSRVGLAAHQVRFALRALQEAGEIGRVWVRRAPASAVRRSA